uniref:Putative secreted peptide n=1 Tax=Rhipicephalus pulchellus TaxID=72859 RepID=L7MA10_RHIPC
MSALNTAFLLIFTVTLIMINTSSSTYGGNYGRCKRLGKPCRGPRDWITCGPTCVCEQMLQPFYAFREYGYTWSCGNPPAWESAYRSWGQ